MENTFVNKRSQSGSTPTWSLSKDSPKRPLVHFKGIEESAGAGTDDEMLNVAGDKSPGPKPWRSDNSQNAMSVQFQNSQPMFPSLLSSKPPPVSGIQMPFESTETLEGKKPSKRATTESSFDKGPSKRAKLTEVLISNQWNEAPPARRDDDLQPNEVDWRARICDLVGAGSNIADHALLACLGRFKDILIPAATPVAAPLPEKPAKPSYKILHRVNCSRDDCKKLYLDYPNPVGYGNRPNHLGAKEQVANFEVFIERNRALSFIIWKEYNCCTNRPVAVESGKEPEVLQESLQILSADLREVLEVVKDSSDRKQLYPDFQAEVELRNPHLWYFHELQTFTWNLDYLTQEYHDQLALFMESMQENKGQEFAAVNRQLEKKVISWRYLLYLFVPTTQLLIRDIVPNRDYHMGAQQTSWPEIKYSWTTRTASGASNTTSHSKNMNLKLSFKVMTWAYDGIFQRLISQHDLNYDFDPEKPLPIADLPVYPLCCAEICVQSMLLRRGKKFWSCRKRLYVSYSGWDFDRTEQFQDMRFMIDVSTFKRLNPDSQVTKMQLKDELGADAMASMEPPSLEFIQLLPSHLWGFSLQDKKWRSLYVDNISSICWDQDAFKSLVIDIETKELIKALVTNKIDSKKSTDLISGKGSGLVILFHGGPGTGKTLTAESVAEYAKKPLYRVTCGDIGTRPEEVEKYLKFALHLGKQWDCVVLLDEAEVFLQERSLQDINRNALVSVFLRVLEYYDGILILTSNRVGTFDEAFKSRIQLALHYEKLTQSSRKRVWENFINRLKLFETEDIDFEDICSHLDDLAGFNLNGREIRNVVTTARQLAIYKDKPLDFISLRHVINVSGKFDKYLRSVNEGLNGDQRNAYPCSKS